MSAPLPQVLTPAQIDALDNKALVEYFNDIQEALGLEPTRRFSTRDAGLKRTKAAAVELSKVKRPASTMPNLETLGLAGGSRAPAARAVEKKPPSSRNVRRGTNLVPIGHEPIACREGSKQAILLDQLRKTEGVTMDELLESLSGGNKPWTEVTVRSGFGWDLKNKGYGVRSEFDAAGVEHFFLVMPAKYPKVPAHTPLLTSRPKAHAGQKRLTA